MKLNPVTATGLSLHFPRQDPKAMTRTLHPLPEGVGSGTNIRSQLLIFFGAEVFLNFAEP